MKPSNTIVVPAEYIIGTKKQLADLSKKVEHLQEQLRIATKALKQYSWGDNWLSGDCRGQVFLPTKYGYTIADEALEEIEEVK